MPSVVGLIVQAVFAFVWLGIATYVWFNRPTVAIRCGFGVICVLGTILSGPIDHRNYQLWWLPMFAVLLGLQPFVDLDKTETKARKNLWTDFTKVNRSSKV
jgi:hypothetical protein